MSSRLIGAVFVPAGALDARDAQAVREHDVARWAASFLYTLNGNPAKSNGEVPE